MAHIRAQKDLGAFFDIVGERTEQLLLCTRFVEVIWFELFAGLSDLFQCVLDSDRMPRSGHVMIAFVI